MSGFILTLQARLAGIRIWNAQKSVAKNGMPVGCIITAGTVADCAKARIKPTIIFGKMRLDFQPRHFNFISGGALGFDQIAASLVITKKQQGLGIRLIFALPCP